MKTVITSACVGAFAIAASANAGVVIPSGLNLTVDFNGGSWSIWDNPESITDVQIDIDGDVTVTGTFTMANEFAADWTINLSDLVGGGSSRGAGFAFISNSFEVTNLNAVPQDFVMTVSQAEAPIGAPTLITGSNSGNVSDGDGVGGATLESTPGLPFYEAFMDGVSVRTLFDAPQTVVAPQFLTNSYGPNSFTNEPNANGVAAAVSITNYFRLSAGDDAGMVSTFAVIPTPGTTTLLAVAGIAAIRRRR